MSLQEIFDGMAARANANPAKLGTLKATFQFELSGEGGGTWHVRVENGTLTSGQGPAENPGVTLIMAASDYQNMVAGKLNPTSAFMSGKLKIKGDMSLAMKLQTLLR